MSDSRLIELSYFAPQAKTRLTAYADTIMMDRDRKDSVITAIRFGGYPEMVRAMSDAIYGGGTIEAVRNGEKRTLKSVPKGYRRQLAHDGVYATATLMANDDALTAEPQGGEEDEEEEQGTQQEIQPRKCYIFCPSGDRNRLFEELDHKTAAPLIPAFRDYVLDTLTARGDLRQLETISLKEKLDAYVLSLKPEDANVVEILEDGLKSGEIAVPGADPDGPDGFDGVEKVTGYLNTFGATVAQRIRSQFQPLFDPAAEPLSEEVLAVNDAIQEKAGYSLYDAQLAVAEATKRQLARKKIALIVAECGSGKTKIGATALGALQGMHAAQSKQGKTFNLIMAPSHVTGKWVREIGETLPNTFAMVVKSITDLDRLYAIYQAGDRNVYAVFSKEKARDGYMRYPAVTYNRGAKGFCCPDCGKVVQMVVSDDGIKYEVNADQFYFQKEHRGNHTCAACGSQLWSAINPEREIKWAKIADYGWVYRKMAVQHRSRTKNERVLARLEEIMANPDGYDPVRGACRRYALSTYIKKKYRGRIDGFLCDELHEYNNASGQGDAMAELFSVSKLFVGMTATLINGYSSGIFHLLYRLTPGLMEKDDKQAFHACAPGAPCPTCRRLITDEALVEVRAALEQSSKATIAAGQEQRAQLAELQELDAKAKAVFEKFQADDVAALEEKLAGLNAKKGEDNLVDDLRTQIQQLTADLEYGNLSEQEYAQMKECREELRECAADLKAAQAVADQKPDDFDEKIKTAQDKITALKKLISNVVIYMSERAKLTFSALKMNKVEISLYDIVKTTGERKDVFKFTYGGRRYDRLSLSEKIRAGMEVSELMKRLTGRNYPVFVDNMESVDDLANVRPTGQVIMAKCVSGTPLAVRPVKPIAVVEQQAA